MALEDTLWKLDIYENKKGNLVSLLPDTEITAHFRGGIMGGSIACAHYSGNYEGNGNTITISNLEIVLSDCWPGSQDSNFLTALLSAESFEIHGNTMWMINDGGKVVLVFSAHTD